MHLLVTRPQEDAMSLVTRLEEMGHTCAVFPFLQIIHDGPDSGRLKSFTVKQIQGLVFTSANGVRAFCHFDKRRSFRVFAVGDATASAARDCGFKNVSSAQGDVESLAQHIAQHCQAGVGKLLHIAGSKVAGDLAGLLGKDGFDLERIVIYRSEKVTRLSDKIQDEIKSGKIDGVLLYSPRTATSFVELIKKHSLEKYVKSMLAYGLSAAVASKLDAMELKAVCTAKTPDQEALLSLLGTVKDEAMTTNKKDDNSKSDPKVIEGKAEEVKKPDPAKKEADKKEDPKDPKKTDAKSSATPVSGAKKAEPDKADNKDPKAKVDPKADSAKDKKETKPKADAKPAPAPKPKKKGSFKAKLMFATIVILAAGGAGAYYTQDIWIPQVKAEIAKVLKIETPAAQDSRVDDLLVRIEKLENRPVVAAAPASEAPATAAPTVDLEPLLARLATLEETLGALKTEVSSIEIASGDADKLEEFRQLAERLENIEMPKAEVVDLSGIESQTSGLEEAVAALTERLGTVEEAGQNFRSTSDKAQALVAGLSSLRDVLRTSASYENEYVTFTKLAAGDSVLEEAMGTLESHAPSGISSRSALTASFETTANDIVRAIAIPEGEGWMEETFRNITSLVNIRRAPGHMEGEGGMGIVARAEHNVRAGDLPGAIAELEALEGLPGEAAQEWVNMAKARLSADKALSDMQNHILTLISGAGGQG